MPSMIITIMDVFNQLAKEDKLNIFNLEIPH